MCGPPLDLAGRANPHRPSCRRSGRTRPWNSRTGRTGPSRVSGHRARPAIRRRRRPSAGLRRGGDGPRNTGAFRPGASRPAWPAASRRQGSARCRLCGVLQHARQSARSPSRGGRPPTNARPRDGPNIRNRRSICSRLQPMPMNQNPMPMSYNPMPMKPCWASLSASIRSSRWIVCCKSPAAMYRSNSHRTA